MPGRDQRRPFLVSDALVLVAATAGGLALRPAVRWQGSELVPVEFTAERIRNALQARADELAPILGAWTLALALLSLRGPRPRRPARGAGRAVAWGASIGLMVHALHIGVAAAKRHLDWGAFYFRVDRDLYAVENAVRLLLSEQSIQAPAVGSLAALGLHALGGRRRRATDWIDRAGLALGACWIFLLATLWSL